MFDDKGKQVKKATPSMPVEVLGFSDVPNAGDFVQVLEDEKKPVRLLKEGDNISRKRPSMLIAGFLWKIFISRFNRVKLKN